MGSFRPQFENEEIDDCFRGFPLGREVKNSELHRQIRVLTDKINPTADEEFDIFWRGFYLPVVREGETITLPVTISYYKTRKTFSLIIDSTRICGLVVDQGKDYAGEEFSKMVGEVERFLPFLKRKGRSALNVPYDLRTGKTSSDVLLEANKFKPFSKAQVEDLRSNYQRQLRVVPGLDGISTNDYLAVASMIYEVIKKDDAQGLSSLEQYLRFSYNHGSEIKAVKDWNSVQQFAGWFSSKERPQALVGKEIILVPPTETAPRFRFSLGYVPNPAHYEQVFQTFIDRKIPFEDSELEERLEFFGGKLELKVNTGGRPSFRFMLGEDEKYLDRIIWNKLELPKWKEKLI